MKSSHQHLIDDLVQAVDALSRGAGRREQGVPAGRFNVITGLLEGRRVRHLGQALVAGHS